MTDVVARLRQLEAAAALVSGDRQHPQWYADSLVAGEVGGYTAGVFDGRNRHAIAQPPTAEFIAAARNALPQLLAITEAAAEVDATLSYDGSATLEAAERLAAALAALDSQETE